jgi:DNA-binding NarL/FixJ family response regulator
MDKIKVLIVDDDIDWIKSMSEFLNLKSDMYIAAIATNREETLKLINSIEVDVILMDINLVGNKLDGISLAAEISQMKDVKIIMLTVFNDENIITDSFTAGAVNYISKIDYKKIPEAIRSTYKNFSPYEVLLKDYLRLKEEEQLKDLSQPEKEIFKLIQKGYTQSEIENKLFKTKNTIKTQIRSILNKFGVKDSKEAVKKARFGMLSKREKEQQG